MNTTHADNKTQCRNLAGDLKLQAEMPAEVFIQTTARNALQYLFDPVLGILQRSLRER